MPQKSPLPPVLVLAGGAGKKMIPFTLTTPKALLPLATRPMLEHLLADLNRLGFRRVTVAGAKDLADRYRDLDGTIPRGLKVEFIPERSSPLAAVEAGWTDAGRPLLVAPVDVVFGRPEIYRRVFNALRKAKGLLVSVRGRTASLDEDPGPWVHTGILALKPGARSLLKKGGELPELAERARKRAELLDAAMRAPLIGTRAVSEEAMPDLLGGWVDVDRAADLLDAHYVIVARMYEKLGRSSIARSASVARTVERKGFVSIAADATVDEHVHLGSYVWIGKGARIGRMAAIGDFSIVGENGWIGPGVNFYGVIGRNSQIVRSAEFGGMIMEHSRFGHDAHFAGIVGNHCAFSVGVVAGTMKLVNPPFRVYVQGRVEKTHLHGIAIGDHSFIGAGAILMGSAKIGPYSIVGPGVVVYRDVPPNKMVIQKEQVVWRDVHPENRIQYGEQDYGPLWYSAP